MVVVEVAPCGQALKAMLGDVWVQKMVLVQDPSCCVCVWHAALLTKLSRSFGTTARPTIGQWHACGITYGD